MKAIRLVLADDDREFCEGAARYLVEQPDFLLVGVAGTGTKALQQVEGLDPDVLLLDLVLPELDGFKVLEGLRLRRNRPKVIVISAFGEEKYISRAFDLGAAYYLMKPFDLGTLSERIRHVAMSGDRRIPGTRAARAFSSLADVDRAVLECMHRLGIPSHFKGHRYLRWAVAMVIEEPDLLSKMTKELYPRVAEKTRTTPSQVERAMRHAIETSMTKGDLKYIDKVFGYSVDVHKGKPTNSSFIARLADNIRLEMMRARGSSAGALVTGPGTGQGNTGAPAAWD